MIDIATAISSLGRKRPIFHSEADLQHALAWEIHLALPDAAVRLEVQPPGWKKKELLGYLGSIPLLPPRFGTQVR